jgi:hypothetical protein
VPVLFFAGFGRFRFSFVFVLCFLCVFVLFSVVVVVVVVVVVLFRWRRFLLGDEQMVVARGAAEQLAVFCSGGGDICVKSC